MIQFFINKIDKKYQEAEKRAKVGSLAGILGLLSNILLFLGKFLVGLSAGSVSIMADAMNSLSDTISSILTLVAFRVASKPADKEHPYGHERFEYISGMLISLIITFVGFQFLLSSFKKILNPTSMRLSIYVFIILIFSIAIKIWQGRMYLVLAKKIDSEALKATSKDSFNDVYSTIVVLFSALLEWGTGLRVDGYFGFLLALYILYSGISMVRDFIGELLGSRPNANDIQEMEKKLAAYSSILGYHDLLIHNYGPKKRFASVHIEIDSTWSLPKAHQIIDMIEKDFHQTLGVELVCHLDPVAIQDIHYLTIANTMHSIIFHIDPRLRMHDFRINEDHVLQFDLVVPDHFQLSDTEISSKIEQQIKKNMGDYQVDITFDHNYLL